jgi:hypothetical protein
MSSPFSKLALSLSAVASTAKDAKKEIDDLGRSAAGSNISEILAGLTDASKSVDVASLLANKDQQGYAKDILGGPMGAYLQDIARILAELTENKALDAVGIAGQQRLRQSLETFETLIRKFAGPSGQKFSFDQLRAAIQDLNTATKKVERNAARGSSGTIGKTPAKECGASPFGTSVLRASGGLR